MGKKYKAVYMRVEIFIIFTSWLTSTSAAELIPSFIQEPESTVIADGKVAILNCDVVPASAEIAWIFNGHKLNPDQNMGTEVHRKTLRIDSSVAGIDSVVGKYQCVAKTSVGSVVSRPAVLSKAVFEFKAGNDVTISVTEGGTVTLPCFSPDISHPVSIVFQHSTGDIINPKSDNAEVLPSGNIVLKDVKVHQSGAYKCLLINSETGINKTSSFTITLRVHPFPSSGEPLGTKILGGDTEPSSELQLKLNLGEDAVLECPAAGYPEPKVNWTKYAGLLPPTRSKVISGNLHITNIQLRDEGTYLCGCNGSQKFVTLEVKEIPSITVGDDKMEAAPGSSVRLTCHVKGRPLPDITWYHNGKLITKSITKILNGETAKLISKVEQSDNGIYQCMAENKAGVASASILLRVTGQVVDPSKAVGDSANGMVNNPNETTNELEHEDDDEDLPRHKKKKKRKNDNDRKKKRNKKKKNRGKKRRKNKNGNIKLVPPSRPKVKQLSESSVVLNWTVPENNGLPITFFRVQYKEVAPAKRNWQTEDQEIPKTGRSYEVHNLKKGGTYKFRIAAVYSNDDNNIGQNSARFQLEMHEQPITNNAPAEKPTIVEAKPIVYENVYGIGVRWQYRAGQDKSEIDGFILYYKPYEDPGPFKEEMLKGATIREHLLRHLESGTEYSIKMQSFNKAGTSEFSNTVVKRTTGQPIDSLMPKPDPETMKPEVKQPRPPLTHDEGSSQSKKSSEMLYMILGIVLGIMLLLLVVFMFMCWWKQRQQRRMLAMNGVIESKFHDQAHRIYTDSMRKKYANGMYPTHNGLNGYVTNGHGPHGHHKMNLNVNPVQSDLPTLTRNQDSNKYYHNHVPNGGVGTFGHNNTSDNNFNNINTTKQVLGDPDDPSQPMLSDSERVENMEHVYRPNCCPNHHYHQTLPGHSSNEGDISGTDTYNGSKSMPPQLPPGFERLYRSEDRLSHKPFVDENLGPCERQSYDSLSPADHPSGRHSSKHRHRRKQRHSREQTTRDQATNTDLSSNEGTSIEFTTFNKSDSTSDQANVPGGSQTDLQCTDFSHLNQEH